MKNSRWIWTFWSHRRTSRIFPSLSIAKLLQDCSSWWKKRWIGTAGCKRILLVLDARSTVSKIKPLILGLKKWIIGRQPTWLCSLAIQSPLPSAKYAWCCRRVASCKRKIEIQSGRALLSLCFGKRRMVQLSCLSVSRYEMWHWLKIVEEGSSHDGF